MMASINATNAKMPLRPNDRASPPSLSTIIIYAVQCRNCKQGKKDYWGSTCKLLLYSNLSLAKTGIIQGSIWFTAGSQRVEQSMTLVVKCRGCGYVFPSRVQIDQLEYGKTAILEDRTETCPKCGKTSNYNTEDYWFQS
ncbi:MAG: hypothetical protein M3288_10525 [Thermoproteota archaeon]|nr:hypothetical protein [Thermoproteota archaeon]